MDLARKCRKMIKDPFIRNVPYKVELNRYGSARSLDCFRKRSGYFHTDTGKLRKLKIAAGFKL